MCSLGTYYVLGTIVGNQFIPSECCSKPHQVQTLNILIPTVCNLLLSSFAQPHLKLSKSRDSRHKECRGNERIQKE